MDKDDMMIELLARQAIGINKIKEIITKNKRNPKNYVLAYNACNGENNVKRIAEIAKVTPGTIVPILKQWEEEGIIYNIGEKTPLYKSIARISKNK